MVDRRKFLGAGVQVCGMAAFGCGSYILGSYLSPIPEGLGEEEVEIPEGDLASGEGVQVLHKGKPVLIVRDIDGKLHGLSAVCTHLGCLVKWNPKDGRIECPCHDASFTLNGEVLGGPAPEPLGQVPVGIKEGMITVGGDS
ncbi:MAG: ubiquinol-cytochrome c reductase iron-sulfur subunit [Planctomycetota bacterium]